MSSLFSLSHRLFSGGLVALSAVNLGLLYLAFSVPEDLGFVFITINLVALLQMFVMLPFEQLIFYLSREARRSEQLIITKWCFLCLTTLGGVAYFFVSITHLDSAVLIPSAYQKYTDGYGFLQLIICAVIGGGGCHIIQQQLNCDGRIKLSFLLNILPILVQLLALIFVFFTGLSWRFYLSAFAMSYLVSVMIGLLLVKDLFFVGWMIDRHTLISLFAESAKVKFVHNLHNASLVQALNSVGGAIEPSVAVLFFGAKRLFDAVQQVIIIPLSKTFPVMAMQAQQSAGHNLPVVMRKITQSSIRYFAVGILAIVGIAGLSAYFELYQWRTNGFEIFLIAIGFSAYSLMVCIDYPYSVLLLSLNKLLAFFLANIAFSSVLLGGAIAGMQEEIMLFFVSLIFGQALVVTTKIIACSKIVDLKSS